MAKLTADRDTRRREGAQYAFESASQIFAGALVSLDASGKAVPAEASGNAVVGVAQNSANAGENVWARRSVFLFDNDASAPLAAADIGSECFVVDDQTVAKSGTARAGICQFVDDEGVWVKI